MDWINKILREKQSAVKNFFQCLRNRRTLISLNPSRTMGKLADWGLGLKNSLKTKVLDKFMSGLAQKKIRRYTNWAKRCVLEKYIKSLILAPIGELFHYFFAKHTKTVRGYYCQSYVFMFWFYAVFLVKLYYISFTDTPTRVDTLIYIFFFWNFCFYYVFRRAAVIGLWVGEYSRYVLYQVANLVLFVKFFIGDPIFFLNDTKSTYEDNIIHSESVLNPMCWFDEATPLLGGEWWYYYLEHYYMDSVVWVPFFALVGLVVVHFIDDWKDGIVYFKTRYWKTYFPTPRHFWVAIRAEMGLFYNETFIPYVKTAALGIWYYVFLFISCGPVSEAFSLAYIMNALSAGFWIVTLNGRLIPFIVLSAVMYKVLIRFRKDPHAAPSATDARSGGRRRFNFYSPSVSVLNSVFIYGIPFCLVTNSSSAVIRCIYEKFFTGPDYVMLWLTILVLFFLVSSISSSYRGDKQYAILSAFYCSAFTTLLFVALVVYYRTMVLAPQSEIAWARYVLVDFAGCIHASYYPEFLFWGYDYVTLVLCIMTSAVFTFTFYSMARSKEVNAEWLVFWLLLAEFLVLGAFLSLNLLSFFMLFEALTIPFVAILLNAGSSIKKKFAAKQLAVYSLVGGAPMLVATVYLYTVFKTTNVVFITNHIGLLTYNERTSLFFALLLAFAVKTPLFPFHSWLLNAHVEAPTAGSIILASVLLKLGIYGILRFILGPFPDMVARYSHVVLIFAVFGVFYSALCAATETDCKRIIAFSSIGHMSLCVSGIFVCDPKAIYGAIYMVIGHAITSLGLFYMVGILYNRTGSRDITAYGGLSTIMPVFSTIFFMFIIINSGFPISISFLGELHLIAALMQGLSFPATAIIIFSSCVHLYAQLRLFYAVCFGSPSPYKIVPSSKDLNFQEFFVLVTALTSALTLFFFSCHFFWPLEIGYLGEYLYSAEQALRILKGSSLR